MLKHVRSTSRCRSALARSAPGSPRRAADTLSIDSTVSFSSLLHVPGGTLSRSSSCASLNETHSSTGSTGSSRSDSSRSGSSGSSSSSAGNSSGEGRSRSCGRSRTSATPTATIRLYTRCLRPDLEYRTMSVQISTTARQLVEQLLTKYRMRYRDPNLFYLSMEVANRGPGACVRTILVLDDDSCPAQLQACYPRVDARFTLRCRQDGLGLVKVFDSVLMTGSLYKSLLVSERTTAEEMIQLLLNCYDSTEKTTNFSLYEVCHSLHYERKLHGDDRPLVLQNDWSAAGDDDCSFVLRKRLTLTPRAGREFPLRRSFACWSRSQDSRRRLSAREVDSAEPRSQESRSRQPRSLRGPPMSLLTDSDSDDVFYI